MTRLAREGVKFWVVLAVALTIGAAVHGQAKPTRMPAQKSHPTAAARSMKRPADTQRSTRVPDRRLVKPMRRRMAKRAEGIAVRHAAARRAKRPVVPTATAAIVPAAASSPAPAGDQTIDLVGKRDPFVALVNTAKPSGPPLPPGKAGLVIGTLTVQGTVQGANGVIAVIANPDQRVYFVREGDRLYDGVVEKISLDSVTFQQDTKDAFGKPIERTVVKRIYPSAGDQQ